ncbi:Caspase-3-like [Oopsacas minuta]|uniref:Caspase-3-like n=1 Tax=Oopsacas minuta TaxID=111878 RepID=A0AAV7JZ67_9METZ|nr:Caspase-3-like [Oopsacas minuta]
MADSTATDKPRKSRFVPLKGILDSTSDTRRAQTDGPDAYKPTIDEPIKDMIDTSIQHSGGQTDGRPLPIDPNILRKGKGTSATSGAKADGKPPPKVNAPELAVLKSKPETAKPGTVKNYDDDLNYRKGRGEGIIFVNENFRKLPKRSGAKKDLEYLTNIYAKYNIKCDNNIHYDLKGSSFYEKLENLSETVAEDCSVILVSISSHGGTRGKVLGTDGSSMTVLDMVEIFQSNENLLGIPKVFIVQAWRGDNKEVRYYIDIMQYCPDGVKKAGDILIAYSTSEGFVSWRDPKNGSWFLKILHDCVMDPRYRNLHLVEILTVCSNLIITECEENESGDYLTETPSYYSTLRRFLRLNPEEKGDKKALK